jgi:hypothetical protein
MYLHIPQLVCFCYWLRKTEIYEAEKTSHWLITYNKYRESVGLYLKTLRVCT